RHRLGQAPHEHPAPAPAPFSASRVFFPLSVPIPTATGRARRRRGSRSWGSDAPSYSRATSPLGHLTISVTHDFPASFSPAPDIFHHRVRGAICRACHPAVAIDDSSRAAARYVPAAECLWGAAPLSSSASTVAVAVAATAPPPPSPSPSPAVTFWQRDNVRDHVRKLQQTIELSTALIKELEEIAAAGNPGDGATETRKSASSSAELPWGSGDSSEDKRLGFVELARSMGISQDTHESMATDAANYLCHQLQHLLGPISSATSQSGPWEERSAMVRLTQKLQKSKRNKRWRQRRRKHVAELFQKERADYDRVDREADEWRAKQIAKDIAKRRVESMQQIARKKTNEERKRLESELELALMVEKLQELRSIRVQKMKKQGHFLPEEDDKYLERVKAAVEEEERQAASAARTDAVKDAILTAEESRKPLQYTNSQEGGSEQPKSGPSEDEDQGDGGMSPQNVGDSFIRPGGSRIPGHWVPPPPPADEVWASYLVQHK
ncbi:U11/U12 small nuclear ribonucleoprotein, partial [Zea mays]